MKQDMLNSQIHLTSQALRGSPLELCKRRLFMDRKLGEILSDTYDLRVRFVGGWEGRKFPAHWFYRVPLFPMLPADRPTDFLCCPSTGLTNNRTLPISEDIHKGINLDSRFFLLSCVIACFPIKKRSSLYVTMHATNLMMMLL